MKPAIPAFVRMRSSIELGLKRDGRASADELFWIGATKVEALFGLGRRDEAESLKTEIVEKERQRLTKAGREGNAVNWMGSSLNDQLKKLGELLPP